MKELHTDRDWEALAKGLLKAELKKRAVTYAQLVGKLADIGVMDSEPNIRNKLGAGQVYSGVPDPMPRGYRCIVIASLGCLIAAAPSEPEQHAKADQQHSGGHRHSAIAPRPLPTLKPVQPPKYEAPCHNPQDGNACNLEAAWEQAQGSRDSAKWAFWQVVLAAIGSVAVIVSLAYTRRAVKIAGEATRDADKALEIAARNADAAQAHVALAKETSETELRAYVFLTQIEHFDFEVGKIGRFKINLINSGRTPAL